MRVTLIALPVIAVLFVVFCLLTGCIGNGGGTGGSPVVEAGAQIPSTKTELPVAVPYQIPSPTSLALPEGVDAAIWQQLTTELERQLIAVRGASRVGDGLLLRSASTPPTRPRSQAILSSTTAQLRWGYYSTGDYDQNGEVNVADLTPIAIHYQETNLPFGFLQDSILAVVDGDANGEINLADIAPIAINFQNNVAKYNIYRSKDLGDYPAAPDSGNGSAELHGSLTLDAGTGNPNETRLQFVSSLQEGMNNDYFWVRPVDNEAVEGIASNRVGPLSNTFTLEGYIYMAGGGTDPLPGVPVELSGDSTVIATSVTDINGRYSFDIPGGEYTVTPTGDPYGYSPESIDATITNVDKYLPPIYPTPVDIIHRWGLEGYAGVGGGRYNICIDGDENVFISGHINVEEDNRFYLLKYDLFGELIWSQVYDLPYSSISPRLFLLPGGEMYLCATYSTIDSIDTIYRDLYVMKVDSNGKLLWDFAFNYPTLEDEEHNEGGMRGYVDGQDNLTIWAKSNDDDFHGTEIYSYSLKISPAGELLEQTHYEPSSPEYDRVWLRRFSPDPWGGMFVSGTQYNDSGGTGRFLIRLLSNGETDWVNHWGDSQVRYGREMFGSDDYFYQLFEGHPPGDTANHGIQFARFDKNGVRDWEVLYSTDYRHSEYAFDIGPQGKLWVAGDEEIERGFYQKVFPYIWSLQQNDGSLRFAHQWLPDGNEASSVNVTNLTGMKVNRFGVVCATGTTNGETGEWIEHAVTGQDTNWEITHEGGFTTHTDELADLRDPPVSETPDVGIIDPELDRQLRTFIMLYRP